jgi:hypothetical protein
MMVHFYLTDFHFSTSNISVFICVFYCVAPCNCLLLSIRYMYSDGGPVESWTLKAQRLIQVVPVLVWFQCQQWSKGIELYPDFISVVESLDLLIPKSRVRLFTLPFCHYVILGYLLSFPLNDSSSGQYCKRLSKFLQSWNSYHSSEHKVLLFVVHLLILVFILSTWPILEKH